MEEYFLVLDCGATSLRSIAISPQGTILASSSLPNQPCLQEEGKEWLIWDIEEIWQKICQNTRRVVAEISGKVLGVAVTTFGADGAPFRKDGRLTYPVISWQCSRTVPWAEKIASLVEPRELFRLTGYQIIPFNTLLKLLWLRENAPAALDEAHCFMMLPGIINFRLTGEMTADYTSFSTSMMMDVARRSFAEELLALAGLSSQFFPPFVEAGDVVGVISETASQEIGIPEGVPVVSAGHDTQFAIVGSMAEEGEVILSSGTWEIAALRVPYYVDSETAFKSGMLIELDAEKNLWNPQMLMIAGGVIEWVRRNFFAEIRDQKNIYELMIEQAQSIPPGAQGVWVIPAFMPSGPTKPHGTKGTILGLRLTSSRSQIFRATLEGLSFQLKQAILALQSAFNVTPHGVRVVGGGAKNKLWNQIRSDVLGLPVVTTSCEEATVLGATLFVMVGVGYARNLEEERKNSRIETHRFEPSEHSQMYQLLFEKYEKLPILLKDHYVL
ncbi:MAG: FGGY family carbohydrate kinase [Candidatus Caldatribacteriaceae bacterium]